MQSNVLEWLDRTADRQAEKICYRDDRESITFAEARQEVRRMGEALAERLESGSGGDGSALEVSPVAVMLGRSVRTILGYLAVVYAGHCYAPVDAALPAERIRSMLDTLRGAPVLTDREHAGVLRQLGFTGTVLLMEELAAGCEKAGCKEANIKEANSKEAEAAGGGTGLSLARGRSASDPLYIIFTSGSTGRPKGVITAHASLMNYIEAYREVMNIGADDILGNQSPLDYIAAIRDIYLPLLTGCSSYLIPREYFMEPERLFDCLEKNRVTAVGWSVSAFTVPAALGAFAEPGGLRLSALRKICFSGSVMPGRVLRLWQTALPWARFVNQYGPTEATASCTYYPVDHPAGEDETLPIGVPYRNYRVFLLGEDGRAVPQGEEGEICVGGPVLALGYYNDPDRTARDFIQNPLNRSFFERIYRTGDYGVFRADGMLEFHGRRDRQIKHMGHRVELDEIETAAMKRDGVGECAALYQPDKEIIYLFYTGSLSPREVILGLRESLPGFMVPRRVKQLGALPKLPNGKTDMAALRERMR
ncbi:amino acid adenylation domain-containing protein [Lachnoclostridium sp. Marseille-P6806]|uniref:amino acid adenylation domain-containing protein n=1 Tax=Lachnoclostridium sp. Marseille-P6806 TaxID=2364793 RepID=UPI001031196F|nr:amino acid adenylation domain-containing protein [Lachnoclostridium sp. Marseille-P6806]